MAAESAVLLARLLADHDPSDELFKRYASLRHPRTDAVTRNSRRLVNTLFASSAGSIWQGIRDFVISWVGGIIFRSGMMGQYAYDVGTVSL